LSAENLYIVRKLAPTLLYLRAEELGGCMITVPQKKKKTLVEKLIQFGLDPHEWTIANEGKGFFNTLLLVNKRDPDFKLIGEKDRRGWKNLQLLSI
jgi:hypothetical protein